MDESSQRKWDQLKDVTYSTESLTTKSVLARCESLLEEGSLYSEETRKRLWSPTDPSHRWNMSVTPHPMKGTAPFNSHIFQLIEHPDSCATNLGNLTETSNSYLPLCPQLGGSGLKTRLPTTSEPLRTSKGSSRQITATSTTKTVRWGGADLSQGGDREGVDILERAIDRLSNQAERNELDINLESTMLKMMQRGIGWADAVEEENVRRPHHEDDGNIFAEHKVSQKDGRQVLKPPTAKGTPFSELMARSSPAAQKANQNALVERQVSGVIRRTANMVGQTVIVGCQERDDTKEAESFHSLYGIPTPGLNKVRLQPSDKRGLAMNRTETERGTERFHDTTGRNTALQRKSVTFLPDNTYPGQQEGNTSGETLFILQASAPCEKLSKNIIAGLPPPRILTPTDDGKNNRQTHRRGFGNPKSFWKQDERVIDNEFDEEGVFECAREFRNQTLLTSVLPPESTPAVCIQSELLKVQTGGVRPISFGIDTRGPCNSESDNRIWMLEAEKRSWAELSKIEERIAGGVEVLQDEDLLMCNIMNFSEETNMNLFDTMSISDCDKAEEARQKLLMLRWQYPHLENDVVLMSLDAEKREASQSIATILEQSRPASLPSGHIPRAPGEELPEREAAIAARTEEEAKQAEKAAAECVKKTEEINRLREEFSAARKLGRSKSTLLRMKHDILELKSELAPRDTGRPVREERSAEFHLLRRVSKLMHKTDDSGNLRAGEVIKASPKKQKVSNFPELSGLLKIEELVNNEETKKSDSSSSDDKPRSVSSVGSSGKDEIEEIQPDIQEIELIDEKRILIPPEPLIYVLPQCEPDKPETLLALPLHKSGLLFAEQAGAQNRMLLYAELRETWLCLYVEQPAAEKSRRNNLATLLGNKKTRVTGGGYNLVLAVDLVDEGTTITQQLAIGDLAPYRAIEIQGVQLVMESPNRALADYKALLGSIEQFASPEGIWFSADTDQETLHWTQEIVARRDIVEYLRLCEINKLPSSSSVVNTFFNPDRTHISLQGKAFHRAVEAQLLELWAPIQHLDHFDVSWRNIGNEELMFLTERINFTLDLLDLRYNQLTAECVTTLVELCTKSCVRQLLLDGNDFDDTQSAAHIFIRLTEVPTLELLSLNNVGIGDCFAVHTALLLDQLVRNLAAENNRLEEFQTGNPVEAPDGAIGQESVKKRFKFNSAPKKKVQDSTTQNGEQPEYLARSNGRNISQIWIQGNLVGDAALLTLLVHIKDALPKLNAIDVSGNKLFHPISHLWPLLLKANSNFSYLDGTKFLVMKPKRAPSRARSLRSAPKLASVDRTTASLAKPERGKLLTLSSKNDSEKATQVLNGKHEVSKERNSDKYGQQRSDSEQSAIISQSPNNIGIDREPVEGWNDEEVEQAEKKKKETQEGGTTQQTGNNGGKLTRGPPYCTEWDPYIDNRLISCTREFLRDVSISEEELLKRMPVSLRGRIWSAEWIVSQGFLERITDGSHTDRIEAVYCELRGLYLVWYKCPLRNRIELGLESVQQRKKDKQDRSYDRSDIAERTRNIGGIGGGILISDVTMQLVDNQTVVNVSGILLFTEPEVKQIETLSKWTIHADSVEATNMWYHIIRLRLDGCAYLHRCRESGNTVDAAYLHFTAEPKTSTFSQRGNSTLTPVDLARDINAAICQPRVKTLDFSCMGLSGPVLKAIKNQKLHEVKNITRLFLSQNYLISKQLPPNLIQSFVSPTLQTLIIDDNPLGDTPTTGYLFFSILSNPTLEHISISGCSVGDKALKVLWGTSFKQRFLTFRSLRILDAQRNNITEAGLTTLLIMSVSKMPVINGIYLYDNPCATELLTSSTSKITAAEGNKKQAVLLRKVKNWIASNASLSTFDVQVLNFDERPAFRSFRRRFVATKQGS